MIPLKHKYYYLKYPEFDAAPFRSRRPNKISGLWLPYFEEENKAVEYLEFLDDVEEFDNSSIVSFVFSRSTTLNALKSSLSFRARTSPNVSKLVQFEIQEIEIMFKQDFSSYYGLWWPIVKWAFEKVIAQRPLNMGYIRYMWLEREICLLIKNNAPLKYANEDYEFIQKYLKEYPYNVYWLECLHYIEEGGNYAFYLEYLNKEINNTNIIGDYVSPSQELLFNGSVKQLSHVIWQLRNKYDALPGIKKDISKFFADSIKFKSGETTTWKSILRLISNKEEVDVMPTRAMAHKRFIIDWLKEDSTEQK